MPNPTLSDVHVNAPLTFLSNSYMQDESVFVADKVFPNVPVQFKSDRYYTYDRGDFNRNNMQKRAPSTESQGGGYKVDSTPTYNCEVWALHKDIDDQIRDNSDTVLSPDADATRWLTMQALISREVNWAAAYFGTGIWNTNRTGVASGAVPGTSVLQWNDSSSSPIVDIRALKQAIQLKSGGFRAMKMVIGRQVFDVLCDHPDFVDRIKYGQTPGAPAKVTLQAMAALFELDEVLVMDAIINNGPDNNLAINTAESNAFIGGKSVLLVYTPSAPGLMVPSCGYTFTWQGFLGSADGTRIKSFYMDPIASTRVEIEAAYTQKLVSADLGGFITTVVA